RDTLGFWIPSTCSAYKLPSMANWLSISGLQSAFAPTSSNIPLPLLSFGTWVAIAGLDTPGIVLTLNIAPTSIAPVLPADANESMTPFFKSSKPLATLELGFWVMALVGW